MEAPLDYNSLSVRTGSRILPSLQELPDLRSSGPAFEGAGHAEPQEVSHRLLGSAGHQLRSQSRGTLLHRGRKWLRQEYTASTMRGNPATHRRRGAGSRASLGSVGTWLG